MDEAQAKLAAILDEARAAVARGNPTGAIESLRAAPEADRLPLLRDLTRDLSQAFVRVPVRDRELQPDLGRARDDAANLNRLLELAIRSGSASACRYALDLARDFARDMAGARTRALAHNRDLTRAYALAQTTLQVITHILSLCSGEIGE